MFGSEITIHDGYVKINTFIGQLSIYKIYRKEVREE